MTTACLRGCQQLIAGRGVVVEEVHGHGSPDQGNDTFGYHGAIEDGAPLLLVLHAACHQRTLRGMETTDGTTGNGDEQGGENAVLQFQPLGTEVAEMVPQLWQYGHLDKQTHHQCHSHEQHGKGEDGIELADNLVDGQHRGDDIIAEDDENPQGGGAPDGMQYLGRTIHKHDAHHDQQEDGENQHHLLRGIAQIFAYQFGQSGTLVAQGEHTAQVVVGGSGEDTAEHNPQISNRAELSSHDGTKNRTSSSDVQKLNHKNLPTGKNEKINSVGHGYCRGRTIVGLDNALYKFPIQQIAQHQNNQCN